MDPNKLWPAVLDGHLWLLLAGAAVFGGIGALLHQPAEPPSGTAQRSRWWDVFAGAVAAIAILYVAKPDTGSELVAGSLIAGYAADAVLAALQARLTAAVATSQATENRRLAEERKTEADAATRLAADRAREALQVRQDLDQLTRAAEIGIDIKSIASDLRVKRGLAADA